MISSGLPPRPILHLNIRDPSHRFLWGGANNWACPEWESVFFKWDTVWGVPNFWHSANEVDALAAQFRGIGDEMLRRALETPIVSDAPKVILHLDGELGEG